MRFRLPTAITVAGLLTTAIAASVATAQQAGAAVTLRNQVISDATTSLTAMSAKSSADDGQYLLNGRMTYPTAATAPCPRCELGPAVAAAAIARRTGNTAMLNLSRTVFDAALRDQVKADGSFATAPAGENDNTIQTVFFAEHLGSALVYLGTMLDADTRARYIAAQAKAVDVLVARGLLSYYINGNINLAFTVAIGQAAKLTVQPKYKAYYEKSLEFTLRPGSAWAGFGLQTTKVGALSSGADSAGYLAEKGKGAPGFDPEYAHFQSEFAGQGYQTLGDTRLLNLANQLTNYLMPRVTTGDWTYDITGGSRKARTTGRDRFITPSFYVTAAAGRSENLPLAESQIRAVTDLIRVSPTTGWGGLYQSWGTSIATEIYALA